MNNQNFATLLDLLNYRQQYQPNQIGYRFLENGEQESGCLTYQELAQRAEAIASQLHSCLEPGDRVLLLHPPGLEFIASFFGCLRAGMIAVPTSPPKWNQPKLNRLRMIREDSQAKMALTTTAELSKINLYSCQNSKLSSLKWLATDQIHYSKSISCPRPDLDANSVALLQYTSSSNSFPQAVIITHGNLLDNLTLIQQYFGITSNDRGVIWLPPYHNMGLIAGILQPLFGGNPMILMPSEAFIQKPIRWLKAIAHYRATISGAPDSAYDLTSRQFQSAQELDLDLSCWEMAFCGVESVHRQTIERFTATFAPWGFRQNAFHPCYGKPETTLFVSGGYRTDSLVFHSAKNSWLQDNSQKVDSSTGNLTLVGCSRVWSNQNILIVDPQTLTECPNGEVGEIWVEGASVAQGYWNQPLQTQQTFQAYLPNCSEKAFLRTGDWGFIENGELFVMEQPTDLITIQSRKYYPQSIEQTVEKSHPSLQSQSGAAFSLRIGEREKLVILQEIEPSYRQKLDVHEVMNQIISAVAEEHEVSVQAIALFKTNTLPKTSSNKVHRRACRAKFLEGNLEPIADWSVNAENKQAFIRLQSDIDTLCDKIGRKNYVK